MLQILYNFTICLDSVKTCLVLNRTEAFLSCFATESASKRRTRGIPGFLVARPPLRVDWYACVRGCSYPVVVESGGRVGDGVHLRSLGKETSCWVTLLPHVMSHCVLLSFRTPWVRLSRTIRMRYIFNFIFLIIVQIIGCWISSQGPTCSVWDSCGGW